MAKETLCFLWRRPAYDAVLFFFIVSIFLFAASFAVISDRKGIPYHMLFTYEAVKRMMCQHGNSFTQSFNLKLEECYITIRLFLFLLQLFCIPPFLL